MGCCALLFACFVFVHVCVCACVCVCVRAHVCVCVCVCAWHFAHTCTITHFVLAFTIAQQAAVATGGDSGDNIKRLRRYDLSIHYDAHYSVRESPSPSCPGAKDFEWRGGWCCCCCDGGSFLLLLLLLFPSLCACPVTHHASSNCCRHHLYARTPSLLHPLTHLLICVCCCFGRRRRVCGCLGMTLTASRCKATSGRKTLAPSTSTRL